MNILYIEHGRFLNTQCREKDIKQNTYQPLIERDNNKTVFENRTALIAADKHEIYIYIY